MKDKLILNNEVEIEIESASSLSDIRVISENPYEMITIWTLFNPNNLKSVQIKNSEDVTIAQYENLVLDRETSIIQEDGTVLTSFYLREKTDVELLREELESLKEDQEVQNGAITDLGEAVSGLAEEGGFA